MTEVRIDADHVLDCRGQLCPMPVVRLGAAVSGLNEGEVLKVMVTDRGAISDVPAWARDTGNTLLHWDEEPGHLVFYVRKEREDQD